MRIGAVVLATVVILAAFAGVEALEAAQAQGVAATTATTGAAVESMAAAPKATSMDQTASIAAGAAVVPVDTVIVSNVICEASASAGLGVTWTAYLTNAIDASPAISPDGTRIFIATKTSQFLALYTASGAVDWCVTLPNDGNWADITSSATVAANGSAVYVGFEGGYLMAYNPTNGAVKWSNYLGGYISSSPALSHDSGTIYVGTYNTSSNGLYAVNAATGSNQWYFETDDSYFGLSAQIECSPSVAPDGSIVFLAEGWGLYSVNSDGSLRWFFPMPSGSAPDASPALASDGTTYIGSSGNSGYGNAYVYAINSAGGLEWALDAGDTYSVQSSVAIGADLTVYAASTDGTLYAITNGAVKWMFTDTNRYPFLSSPAVSQDNVVFIGSADSHVYAITNGHVKAVFPTYGNVISSPVINPADGAIIVADTLGHVYKLPGAQSADPDAPWPMFHQNARRAGATPNGSASGGGVAVAFPNNPYFSASGVQTNFNFYVSGTPASLWIVYASSNLTDWSNIGSFTLTPSPGTAFSRIPM